jgi:chromosome partitioning protein
VLLGNIVAFVNQKGGTGKSSTSVHFTVWLATKLQKQVLLVDADPQRSSSLWLQSMDIKIPAVTLDSADDILEDV